MVGFKSQTPLRKAAILVSALDHRVADVVLERMPLEQAARIRQAVLQLGDVPDEEQQAVLREFLRSGNAVAASGDAGVEVDAALARKLSAAPAESLTAAAPARAGQPPLFRALRLAAPESLARHLRQEHPQIIAVVLAHLPPARSAEVVKRLPERLQVDVLRRVAELDRADPHVLRDLELELEQRLSGEIRAAQNRSAGLSAVASILAAAGNDRDVIVRSVSRLDEQFSSLLGVAASPAEKESAEDGQRGAARPPLSVVRPEEEPGPPSADDAAAPAPAPREALPFADLELLDDHALATLFATADADVALLALSGANESLVERMTRQLPARQARSLRRGMERLGPLRLSDIEQAQLRMAALAEELLDRGAIAAPRRRWAAAA